MKKSHSILGLRQFGEVFIQKASRANQEELREGVDASLRAARLRLGKPERERRTATARHPYLFGKGRVAHSTIYRK